jgi:hypothetical protein
MRFLAVLFFFALSLPAVENQRYIPELALVHRVYVEPLGGGHATDQMRDMIIAALQRSGLFVITEDKDRADATLRGSSDDKVFNEEHDTNESLGVNANTGISSSTKNYESGVSSSHSGGLGINQRETSHIQEHRHEASASLRLVNCEGDVIWSTTQESPGGKFRGALADVADKVVRQLVEDVTKAKAEEKKNLFADPRP